eukprot:357412_1
MGSCLNTATTESTPLLTPPTTKSIQSHNVSNCSHIKSLIEKLNSLHNAYLDSSTSVVKDLLDDYLHIIDDHSTDEEFQIIYQQLEHCDIQQCYIIEKQCHLESNDTAALW